MRVQFASPVLQGYSTHIAPALTQVEQIPLATWDPTAPRYFSGTGCEARGTAVPLTGYVSHAQLCINDTVVEEYWDTAAAGKPSPLPTDGSVVTGTSQASATVKALFDSTHFAYASTITIKMKVTDSNGGYYEATVVGPAYNKALVLSNNTLGSWWNGISFDDLYEKVAQTASSINDSITANKYYHVSDIETALPLNTVFYINSHGNENTFDDCFGSPKSDDTTLASGDITIALYQKLTDPAHINRPNGFAKPPYNFVQLDCCDAADDPSVLGGAFGIAGSDQCFLGWSDELLQSTGNANWSEMLWALMARGFTVYDAVLMDYSLEGSPLGKTSTFAVGYIPQPITAKIWGDKFTTLHGFYRDKGHATSMNNIEEEDTTAARWERPL